VLSATRWSHAEIPKKQIPKPNEAQLYEKIEGEGRERVIFRFILGVPGFVGVLEGIKLQAIARPLFPIA
jgi:hypothetical protein